MSQIADTENALMRTLEGCQLPAGVSIETAPGEWSPGYIQRLLDKTPAVRLAFLGAQPFETTATALQMRAEWAAYCIVGWAGQDQSMRRLAVDGGYDMVARVAPILHSAPLMDAQRPPQRLPLPSVTGIEVLTDAAYDTANLWIAAVLVEVELPLDIPEDCTGPLDDFLRVRGRFDLPDPAPDLPLAVDIPRD